MEIFSRLPARLSRPLKNGIFPFASFLNASILTHSEIHRIARWTHYLNSIPKIRQKNGECSRAWKNVITVTHSLIAF